MKLLSVSFNHVKLFENGIFELDLFASDKVPASDESVTLLEKPLAINNVVALAGINASGKTTALRLMALALSVVQGGLTLHSPFTGHVEDLFDAPPRMKAVLWEEGQVFILDSVLAYRDSAPRLARGNFIFEEEVLYRFKGAPTKALFRQGADALIDHSEEIMRRSTLDHASKMFLADSVSIMTSQSGTIASAYHASGDAPLPTSDNLLDVTDILRAFDADIEFLRVQEDGNLFELKFKRDERPALLSRKELEHVLSSGTLRGLSLVQSAVFSLACGGYFLLDEIENHLNKQLVHVIVDLFVCKESNPYGAVLIFTTHYPEILDSIHRKDCVYFLAREADGRTCIVKYSDRVDRIENKKSEVFLSNYIKGTAPRFADVAALRSYAKSITGGLHHE